jgi:hypothetical protein
MNAERKKDAYYARYATSKSPGDSRIIGNLAGYIPSLPGQ